MPTAKRRACEKTSLPDEREPLRKVRLECDHLREKIRKSVIDNPRAAKKAAFLIGLWIEGKESKRKKAG